MTQAGDGGSEASNSVTAGSKVPVGAVPRSSLSDEVLFEEFMEQVDCGDGEELTWTRVKASIIEELPTLLSAGLLAVLGGVLALSSLDGTVFDWPLHRVLLLFAASLALLRVARVLSLVLLHGLYAAGNVLPVGNIATVAAVALDTTHEETTGGGPLQLLLALVATNLVARPILGGSPWWWARAYRVLLWAVLLGLVFRNAVIEVVVQREKSGVLEKRRNALLAKLEALQTLSLLAMRRYAKRNHIPANKQSLELNKRMETLAQQGHVVVYTGNGQLGVLSERSKTFTIGRVLFWELGDDGDKTLRASDIESQLVADAQSPNLDKTYNLPELDWGDGVTAAQHAELVVQSITSSSDSTFRSHTLQTFLAETLAGVRLFRRQKHGSSTMHAAVYFVASLVCWLGVVAASVAVLELPPLTVLTTLLAVVVSISFALGSTAQQIVAGAAFVLLRRPFEVGDRVRFRKAGTYSCFVSKISLLSTTFMDLHGISFDVANSQLAMTELENHTRSQSAVAEMVLRIGHRTTQAQLDALTAAVVQFARTRSASWRRETVQMYVYDVSLKNGMSIAYWVTHKAGHEKAMVFWSDKGQLMLFVKDTLMELGIELLAPVQPVTFGSTLPKWTEPVVSGTVGSGTGRRKDEEEEEEEEDHHPSRESGQREAKTVPSAAAAAKATATSSSSSSIFQAKRKSPIQALLGAALDVDPGTHVHVPTRMGGSSSSASSFWPRVVMTSATNPRGCRPLADAINEWDAVQWVRNFQDIYSGPVSHLGVARPEQRRKRTTVVVDASEKLQSLRTLSRLKKQKRMMQSSGMAVQGEDGAGTGTGAGAGAAAVNASTVGAKSGGFRPGNKLWAFVRGRTMAGGGLGRFGPRHSLPPGGSPPALEVTVVPEGEENREQEQERKQTPNLPGSIV